MCNQQRAKTRFALGKVFCIAGLPPASCPVLRRLLSHILRFSTCNSSSGQSLDWALNSAGALWGFGAIVVFLPGLCEGFFKTWASRASESILHGVTQPVMLYQREMSGGDHAPEAVAELHVGSLWLYMQPASNCTWELPRGLKMAGAYA